MARAVSVPRSERTHLLERAGLRRVRLGAGPDPTEAMRLAEWCASTSGIYPDIIAAIIGAEMAFSWNLHSQGDFDQGGVPHSFGPFQVYTDVHGGDATHWSGFEGGQRAWMEVCRDRWLRAMGDYAGDPSLAWANDPAGFIATYWPAAQGCDPGLARRTAPQAAQAGIAAWKAYAGSGEPFTQPLVWDTNEGWYKPVFAPVGQRFGENIADYPLTNKRGHPGQDFPCDVGTPVYAMRAGRVTYADLYGGMKDDPGTGYGRTVMVRDADGSTHMYCHLSEASVSAGQDVALGQRIALSGNTGRSTGPHLHYEVRLSADVNSFTDPDPWLRSLVPVPTMKAVTLASVNIRSQPETSQGTLIYTAPNGFEVAPIITGSFPMSVWVPIAWGQRLAYVYGSYIKGSGGAPPPPPGPDADALLSRWREEATAWEGVESVSRSHKERMRSEAQ